MPSDRFAGGSGLSGAVRKVASTTVGAAVRRLRRELQWRDRRVDFEVVHGAAPFEHVVAEHATPLMRRLAGVDERLQRNKAVNLRIAAACLDGVVLQPGQRLSFWREVGKPTARRGFLEGLVLRQGRLGTGVGGGLCQMSNLLFWMTLHTPLTVVERWRHSYDVFPDAARTQPFGSGATVAWPMLDLQIENRTSVPYQLSLTVTDTHLVGAWTAPEPACARYRIEERNHRITHEGPGVYVRHNELWREAVCPDGRTEIELVAVNDARMMYAPFLPEAAQSSPVA
ncbi:VanW family protein [Coriobacteriia bacterium Es71-Z0120]|uniref:VanW family protein n=1 Tax=Parvivirga hydrogeniphila TaxID=2939460 RepID=UPI00226099BC|nr:VanW family protein [Parvivirga hydrogeniphila]MCL4078145.1 VanW family protein [Parvivirga hydrogeniphila]